MEERYNKIRRCCIVALNILLLQGGCTYGDSERYNFQAGKVHIALDWHGLSCNDSTSFYFYEEGNTIPQIRSSVHEGFEGTLPSGNYRVFVVNNNYRQVSIDCNSGFGNANAHVADREKESDLMSGILIHQPDNLYGGGLDGLRVNRDKEETYVIVAQKLFRDVRLNIRFVGDISVIDVSGLLSGIASSVHIPSGKIDVNESAVLPIQMERGEDGIFHSRFSCLGFCQGETPEGNNYFRMELLLADGTKFDSEIDITSVIRDALSTGKENIETTIDIHIEIDPSEATGFRLVVVGWNEGTGEA